MKNNYKKINLILGLIMVVVLPFVLLSFTNIIDTTVWGGWLIFIIFIVGCVLTYLTIKKDRIEDMSTANIDNGGLNAFEKVGSALFKFSKGLIIFGIILAIVSIFFPYTLFSVMGILCLLIIIGIIQIICSLFIKKSSNIQLKKKLLVSNVVVLIVSSLLIYLITK